MKNRPHYLYILPAVIVLGITIFFGTRIPFMAFDYDLEKFFPKNDKEGKAFEAFRSEFGSDYDYLLIGIGHTSSIYDTAFLNRVGLLADSLEQISGIQAVVSLPRIEIPVFGGLMARRKKLVHLNDPELLKEDSVLISKSGMFEGSLIGRNNRSVCLYVETDPGISKKRSDEVLAQIESVLAHFQFPDTFSGGKIKAQKYFIDKLTVELLLFLGIAGLMVIIILIAMFRSFSGLWMPLIVVGFSLISTLGFMEITGKGIDILGSVIPCVMFVVSMSSAIHFYGKFRDERAAGREREEAVITAFTKIGKSTFLTSLTTAIGFLCLLTTGSPPVMDFGLYCAAGVGFSYLITMGLMPFFLRYFRVKPIDTFGQKSAKGWLFLWKIIEKRRKAILITFAVLTVIFGVGTSFIEANNRLTEDVRESSPLMIDMRRLEAEFSGVRPFEMVIEGEDLFSYENLKKAEQFEQEVKEGFKLGYVQSHVSLAKTFNMSMHNGNPEYFHLPKTQEEYDKMMYQLRLNNVFGEDALLAFLNKTQTRARISGKVYNVTGKEMLRAEKEFTEKVKSENFPFNFAVTGSARLIDINIQNLTLNLAYGLLLGFVIVCIIIGIIFKSVRVAIIGLLPNIFPLLAAGAVLGYFGIPLKTSTAIIFTIGFGIAVDDTIHFLSRLKIEMGLGKPFYEALKITFTGTGKAMALTTIVLVAGFIPLTVSGFLATFYLGLLLSLLLVVALAADIFLLPVILLMFPGKLKSKK
ncbi:MAG: efflux RND transporter permease subunit [Flavobacteriales bacterium]|nr:efflux RND transporter permease subunit [Flavobacteriales bacterium]